MNYLSRLDTSFIKNDVSLSHVSGSMGRQRQRPRHHRQRRLPLSALGAPLELAFSRFESETTRLLRYIATHQHSHTAITNNAPSNTYDVRVRQQHGRASRASRHDLGHNGLDSTIASFTWLLSSIHDPVRRHRAVECLLERLLQWRALQLHASAELNARFDSDPTRLLSCALRIFAEACMAALCCLHSHTRART